MIAPSYITNYYQMSTVLVSLYVIGFGVIKIYIDIVL